MHGSISQMSRDLQEIQLYLLRIDGAAADFSKVFFFYNLIIEVHILYAIYSSVKGVAIFSKVFS